MKLRTDIKAGSLGFGNHSQTQQTLVIRSGVKAGGAMGTNHSQTIR
jgi:hypothetical protein